MTTSNPNNINVSIALPRIEAGKVTVVAAHMTVARELFHGVDALSTLSNIPARSCSMIAAQALECVLKAFLCCVGMEAETRTYENQHNLIALWALAYANRGLDIQESPPDWVRVLSDGHGPNFYFRYQKGEGATYVHGGQTPALIPMASNLKYIFNMVETAIKNR
jgi:hypothetical protein